MSDSKNQGNGLKGIIALVIIVIVAIALIWIVNVVGDKQSKKENTSPSPSAKVEDTANGLGKFVNEEIDISKYEDRKDDGILSAYRILNDKNEVNGYLVKVASDGYGGALKMTVTFENDGKVIRAVAIDNHNETPDIGAKTTEADFLDKFKNVSAPVVLNGEDYDIEDDKMPSDFKDGTYKSETDEFENGYKDIVTMTVKGGKITEIIWDGVDKDGKTKRELSMKGNYVMTEKGLKWHEQADKLAEFVIEHQAVNELYMNDQGKTDTVASVSINVEEFKDLVEECMEKALGRSEVYSTTIDAVTGATTSSEAIVDGVNHAYELLNEFVLVGSK